MRIAVTGANGFVGVHLTRMLAREHEVLAIDNLRYGPWRFSASEMKSFHCEAVDIRDREKIGASIQAFQPEAIIHLAAIHFIPECEAHPDEAIAINTQGTVNLLLACPESCRFVFTSSAAVYAPKASPHVEAGDVVGPVDVYGFTKYHGEEFVRYYAEKRGLQCVTVRLFNVVGPGETNPHILPEIIKQLQAGGRTLNLGNLEPKRDYIYVSDVAAGFTAAAVTPIAPSKGPKSPIVVNLGSGSGYSVKDLLSRLGTICGSALDVRIDPKRVRAVDRPFLVADHSRMTELFRWRPLVNIDQALQMTWDAPDIYR